MTLPFLRQGGGPPGRCSEFSWSPALLWGTLLSSAPTDTTILGQWLQNGKSSVLKHLAPHWASLPWGEQGLQPGTGSLLTVAKTAERAGPQRLDLLSMDACWHLVHTWEVTASLPWHLECASGSAAAPLQGHLVFIPLMRETPQGTHC